MQEIISKIQKQKVESKNKDVRKNYKLLFFAIPLCLFVFMFAYVPLFGWIYAFYDFRAGVPLSKTPFVGLKYFLLAFTDGGDLLRVMKNTLTFYFLGLILSPAPMIFAILLNEIKSKRFKKLVQTTTTLPNFISWVIVFSLAFTIFSYEGLANQILLKYKIIADATNIIGEEKMVFIFQTLLGLWKGLGWGAIIYLAGIAGIDSELYDAAKVDGAGRFGCIRHVTFPGLMATYIVLLLLSISSMVSVGFEQYFVFNNSLVADKIEVLDLYVYRVGFANNDYSYGIAIGIMKTLIGVGLLFGANSLSKKIRGVSIF